MLLYNILPDDTNWGKSYGDDIEVRRTWHMPGIRNCSTCGRTGCSLGVSYPLVDLSSLSAGLKDLKAGTVPVETYLNLRSQVAPFIPEGLPIPPGTEFGPLIGKARGKCGDFAWPKSWIPLVKQDAYWKLRSRNLRLPDVGKPILTVSDPSCCDLLEFQIEPRVFLDPQSYDVPISRTCPKCGRDDRKVEKMIINKSSIPENMDLFRIVNFATIILVTERFKETTEKFGLANIRFVEIESR